MLREQSGESKKGVPSELYPTEFLAKMLKLHIRDFQLATEISGPHLFDRGILDLYAYSRSLKTEFPAISSYARSHRYHRTVFLLEPWAEIFKNDDLRTLNYSDSQEFHKWIIQAYEKHDYDLVVIPNAKVEERANFIQSQIYKSIIGDFEFLDFPLVSDNELSLKLVDKFKGSIERERVPAYIFDMIHNVSGETMGRINLRLGSTPELKLYRGEIGYSVQEQFRGKRYATRSLKIITKLAQAHGLKEFWITCNPENTASRRTLELAGAKLIEIIDLPNKEQKFHDGAPQKCRYKITT